MIDKPAGWTSHDVVGRLRRLLKERRIGHAGTLDPAATGVLPVAVGSATKVLQFLDDASKSYLAEITFGVETDSYDVEGTVVATADASGLEGVDVTAALAGLLGPQRQIPPMHSAVKIDGKRLYESARRGIVVERPARPVVFHRLDLVEWRAPVATVFVECSKGTYIRSLAHDLGHLLGVGGFLSNLVRVRSGPFTLCDSWTVEELAAMIEEIEGNATTIWNDIAIHPDIALREFPALLVGDNGATELRHGRSLPNGPGGDGVPLDGEFARAYDTGGRLLALCASSPDGASWRPVKVFSD